MQTFIFGLLLAFVSGVTVVAFKHPNGYARLFPFVLGFATTVFVGLTIWHVAVEITWQRLDVYIVPDTVADAKSTIGRLSVPYTWVVFWYLGVVAFLWVNLKLPPFLQVADTNDTQHKKEKSR